MVDQDVADYLEAVRRFAYGLDPWEITAETINPDDPRHRELDSRDAHIQGSLFNAFYADEAMEKIDLHRLDADEIAYIRGVSRFMMVLTVESGIVFGQAVQPTPIPPDHPALVALKRYLDHPLARDVESAWMAAQLRRKRQRDPAALVAFMQGKTEAEISEVEDALGKNMEPGALRTLLTRTRHQLKTLGASFEFDTAGGMIFRKSVAM